MPYAATDWVLVCAHCAGYNTRKCTTCGVEDQRLPGGLAKTGSSARQHTLESTLAFMCV